MESLKEGLAFLRREIVQALSERDDVSGVVQLQPERVTVSLNFSIQEEGTPQGGAVIRFGVMPRGTDGKPEEPSSPLWQKLTIEFKVISKGSSDQVELFQTERDIAPAETMKLDSAARDQLAQSLTFILGAPGFDSSARATVFREALAELTDEQAHTLSQTLRERRSPESDSETARAGRLLSRLADSSPVGPVRGRELLAEILQKHPVQLLLSVVEDKWKSQEDWLG